MTEAEDVTFETADAGASHTYPMQAGAIKKNSHVMLKGNPCKVVEYSTSKTGKHGHAKAHIVGLDIFTGKKYEDVCPTSHNMEVPNVKRSEYQLVDLSDDGFCTLLLESGDTKDDLMLPKDSEGNPDEVAQQVKALFADGKAVLLTVLQACGKEKIIACKELYRVRPCLRPTEARRCGVSPIQDAFLVKPLFSCCDSLQALAHGKAAEIQDAASAVDAG